MLATGWMNDETLVEARTALSRPLLSVPQTTCLDDPRMDSSVTIIPAWAKADLVSRLRSNTIPITTRDPPLLHRDTDLQALLGIGSLFLLSRDLPHSDTALPNHDHSLRTPSNSKPLRTAWARRSAYHESSPVDWTIMLLDRLDSHRSNEAARLKVFDSQHPRPQKLEGAASALRAGLFLLLRG
jgi:hypothetical protein